MNFLGKVWEIITSIRTGLANFIFIIFILAFVALLLTPSEDPLPKEAPLLLRISGALVDQLSYQPTIFDIMEEEREAPETLLRDVTFAINQAAKDQRINGLILNLNGLKRSNLSKLEEVGQALENFKASNKPIVAFADTYTQPQYFLASYADEIYLNPMGYIGLTGFSYYLNYYKEAADKLAVKFHLFKAGDFKDAAEPFVRNDMSEASREHKSSWINELWQRYTGEIEARRNLEVGSIDKLISEYDSRLDQSGEDFAQTAKEAGLIDDVISRVELNKKLIERFGKSENSDFFKAIKFKRYLAEVKPVFPQDSNNIGLIVASGTIIDGKSREGHIGGDSFTALIRQAINDESLKALVIRVDSGGGSAFASEVMREEIANARASGLPVYFSMSTVAASGAYWIAMEAEEVWAQPTTITGSIGVWSLLPNLSGTFEKLGVHSDGIGTTPLSDLYHMDRPMSPQAQALFQAGVDNVYNKFISLVAQGRGKSTEEIKAVAQGRVWTGRKALELGLVDKLGSLDDLTASIAQQHSLSQYQLKLIERPLSTSEEIMKALLEQSSVVATQVRTALLGEEVTTMLDKLPHKALFSGNQERGGIQFFAQCIGCLAP